MDASVGQGRMGRARVSRVVVVGGLAVAMFVAGGIGLFVRPAGEQAHGSSAAAAHAAAVDPPIIVSGSLAGDHRESPGPAPGAAR